MTLRLFSPETTVPAASQALLLPLLSRDPLPETHWPYFSRKLECWWLIDVPGWQVPSLFVGPKPITAYRITAQSFAWFWRAVENLAAKAVAANDATRFAFDQLHAMDAWLTMHGLAAEVRTWRGREVQPLPEPHPYCELDVPKADLSFNKRKREEI